MTIEQVKAELPAVMVKIGKKIHQGRISGRLNEQATVTVVADERVYLRGVPSMDWHFAWSTVTKAINENRPLVV